MKDALMTFTMLVGTLKHTAVILSLRCGKNVDVDFFIPVGDGMIDCIAFLPSCIISCCASETFWSLKKGCMETKVAELIPNLSSSLFITGIIAFPVHVPAEIILSWP